MSSLNQIQIIGNLGRDPETRYSHDGAAITNCSIAASEHWKSASGEHQEHTEWFRVVFFGRLAEIAGEYLKKGAKVFVQGRMRTRKYTDKEGAERSITEVHADRLVMLGDRGRDAPDAVVPPDKAAAAQKSVQRPAQDSAQKKSGGMDELDDDVPF